MPPAISPKRLLRSWNERLKGISHRNVISTGMLILSSAALGGIAVALWNRKILAAFHRLEEQDVPLSETELSEIEELF